MLKTPYGGVIWIPNDRETKSPGRPIAIKMHSWWLRDLAKVVSMIEAIQHAARTTTPDSWSHVPLISRVKRFIKGMADTILAPRKPKIKRCQLETASSRDWTIPGVGLAIEDFVVVRARGMQAPPG